MTRRARLSHVLPVVKPRVRFHVLGAALVSAVALGVVAWGAQVNRDSHAGVAPATDLVAQVLMTIQTPAPTYDLEFDRSRNRIWYSTLQTAGPDSLNWTDVASGEGGSVELPSTEYNGFVSETKLASDGAVWVSEPYRLVRFEPESGELRVLDMPDVATEFGVQPPGSGEPLSGSWISSIATDGPNAIVSRNSLLDVVWVDEQMGIEKSVSVDADHSGAMDMVVSEGYLYITAGYTSSAGVTAIELATGRAFPRSGAATSLDTEAGIVLASGAGRVDELGPSSDRVIAPASDAVVVGGLNGILAEMSSLRGSVRVISSDGATLWEYVIPAVEGYVTNPLGHEVKVRGRSQLAAVVVDADGHVWAADASGARILKLG